ncbi:MAG: DNA-methyltransferase [Acidimicrobiales bacterium]
MSTLMTEDFMAMTLDVWSIPPESARRVGHPAPFPVELPEKLIRLYTFRDDLVLDPFMVSGSAMVAAAKLDRRYVGYDLDASYVEIAERRVRETLAPTIVAGPTPRARKPIDPSDKTTSEEDFQSRATREGKVAQKLAEEVLTEAGFRITERNHRIAKTGVTVNFMTEDAKGQAWFFDVSGAFTSHRGGYCVPTRSGNHSVAPTPFEAAFPGSFRSSS